MVPCVIALKTRGPHQGGRIGQGHQAAKSKQGHCGQRRTGKAIAYPTNSKMLNRGWEQQVKLATEAGITLRQNYNREAPKLAGKIARYAYARQYQCMRSHLKKLKTLVGHACP